MGLILFIYLLVNLKGTYLQKVSITNKKNSEVLAFYSVSP